MRHAITLLSLGTLATASLSIAAPSLARAEGSHQAGIEAFTAAVPRDGTGWTNGAATLTAKGDGSYRVSYGTGASGHAGCAGELAIIGSDGTGGPVAVCRSFPSALALGGPSSHLAALAPR